MDIINRDDLMKLKIHFYRNNNDEIEGYISTKDILNIKSYELESLSIRHWDMMTDCSNEDYYCSKCHKKIADIGHSIKKFKFCYNCGSYNGSDNNG